MQQLKMVHAAQVLMVVLILMRATLIQMQHAQSIHIATILVMVVPTQQQAITILMLLKTMAHAAQLILGLHLHQILLDTDTSIVITEVIQEFILPQMSHSLSVSQMVAIS
jgi:hypothetical protein